MKISPSRLISILLLIAFAAFAVRVVAAIYWQTHFAAAGESAVPLYFGDSETYWQLAETIANGKAYQFDEWQIFRMPGYPILLSPIVRVFGEMPPEQCVMAARIENAFVGVILVMAVGWLAFQIFHSQKIAMIAAFFAAFEPCNIISNIWILSETPFMLAMILQISNFIAVLRAETFRKLFCYAILFAVLSAVAVYLRPSWLHFAMFLTLFSFVFSWIFRKAFRKMPRERISFLERYCVIIGVFVPVFILCMSPWWIRNYRVTGHFVSTTLQFGPSLYDGLNPDATGASDMRFVETFRQLERNHSLSDSHNTSSSHNISSSDSCSVSSFDLQNTSSYDSRDTYEYRVNERIKRASIDWIKQNPQRVIELAVIKFLRLWNVIPNEPAFSKPLIRLLIFLTYTPILIGAACGFRRVCRRFPAECVVLIVPAIYITMLHVIFVSSLRYRLPPMLCFMILAACFWGRLKQPNRARSVSK